MDEHSYKTGRTFYDTVFYYDYKYANMHVKPVDCRYVDYSIGIIHYIVSHWGYFGDKPADITDEMIRYAKQGKVNILFDFSFEGELLPLQNFLDHMSGLGLPENSYSAITSAGYLDGFCLPDKRMIHSPMFEVKALKCMRYEIDKPIHSFGLTERRKFIMLNARPRPGRIILSYLLYAANVLDKGYCSVPAETGNVVETYDFFETIEVEKKRGFSNINPATVSKMHAQLPFVVDQVNYNNSIIINDTIFSDIYDLVDFALITETMADEYPGKVFITEKVLKAIANKVPFIVLGDIHTLKYLKQLGYKTFDFLIDESYDSMPYVDRVNTIVAEVTRLCDVDFNKYSTQIKAVTEHNYSVLSNADNYTKRISNVIDFLSKRPT